jgi:two-component system sensor histidine kinase KdpD
MCLTAWEDLTGALFAAVSHDMRRPLTSIKAAATSLLWTEVDWDAGMARELATLINEQADQLDHLLESLLDLSRTEAGMLKAAREAVYIDEVVAKAICTLSLSESQVVVDIPVQMEAITADEGLLERAIANVVANGVSWSRQGSPVRVETALLRETVEIRVIDRGPGIPEDQRESVFLPFSRLARPSGSPHGLGLGLAVAREFVRAVGGDLTVEDTPGGGATFIFRFSRY